MHTRMNLRKGERRGRKGEKERRGREERKERREGEKRESDRVGGEGGREGSRKRGRRESREKRNCITLVLFHNAKLIPRPLPSSHHSIHYGGDWE